MQRDTRKAGRAVRFGFQTVIFGLGFVGAIVMAISSNLLLFRSQADTARFTRALDLQAQLSELNALVYRAEAGQRGYVLNPSGENLAAYMGATEAAAHALADLRAATADQPAQNSALTRFEPQLRQRLAELRAGVDDSAADAGALAPQRRGGPDSLMADMHSTLDQLIVDGRRTTELKTAESASVTFWLVAVRRLAAGAVIVLLIASLINLRRASGEREVALRSLEFANAQLESTIAERTAEIRHTMEVLDTTVNSMAPAVIVLDTRFNVLLANPAAERLLNIRVGTSFDEWSRNHQVFFSDALTPIPREERSVQRALRGESVNNLEVFVRRVDAPRGAYLVANSRPLRDASGTVTGVVVVYQDVTETREIERQLQQAQKLEAVGQLTGGIAHDFNNILTVITGTIGILARAVAPDPMLSSIARMIDDAADRGAELTRRLVAFARRQPLRPHATDINALVVDSAKLLRPTLGEQIAIEPALSETTWPALVDPSQLAGTLINLALNSRDAMPGGGKLTIETANVILDGATVPPGPYVTIAVHDTGTGIPAAIRDKVFEPFFTTKDVGKGSGLGLSMVYGFVKQSGGHIEIDSDEGQGTTVRLYLPRAARSAGMDAPIAMAPIEGGSETVLVVEDDPPVRMAAISQLESLGYSTLSAENAAQALAIIDRGTPLDLLFTDVIMPGGCNGRDLAEAAAKRRPGLRVLFTSGYSEDAIVHHGRLDAGVLLLAKPYRKADLARMVRVALDVRREAAPGEEAA
jgi:PAS domain S-box-containing protein